MTKTTKIHHCFKELSERNVHLILDGGRNTGSFYEGIRTDQLYADECEDIVEFCKFLDDVGGCGPINIQPLWNAFCNPGASSSKDTVRYWMNEFEKYKL